MPQELAGNIVVTKPDGNIRVIFPLAASVVAVVKDTVHACPFPWPRKPVSATLETHLVQGVLTKARLVSVSDEVATFNPAAPVKAETPPTVNPLHVTVTRPDATAPATVIVTLLEE